MQKQRNNLKSKDINVKLESWLHMELLEKLEKYLEEMDNSDETSGIYE